MICKKCNNGIFESDGYKTSNVGIPWQDSDGKFYCGPAYEVCDYKCSICGWKKRVVKRGGKLSESESYEDHVEIING